MKGIYGLLLLTCWIVACRPTPRVGERAANDSIPEKREIAERTTQTTDTPSKEQKAATAHTPNQDPLGYTTEEALEFQEISRPSKVKCWVDGLLVKSFPGERMPKVSTMKEGETAEYLYQRTARLGEYIFRGQKFKDAWYLVKTESGVVGWVHGGGIKFLEASPTDVIRPENNITTQTLVDKEVQLATNDWTIVPGKRVGSIYRNTSEAQLVAKFGADYIQRGEIFTSQTIKENCTYVYRGMPDELAITWKDATRTKVKAVYITQKGGRWHSIEGIKNALSLQELAKINEQPIQFYGFDWEYGGTVGSWRGGKLSKFTKNFYVVLQHNQANTSIEFLRQMKGNKTFFSNSAAAQNVNISVKRITVYLD